MKKLLILAALAISSPASAQYSLHYSVSHVPPHWLLNRGPHIIHVEDDLDYVPARADQVSPSLAVPFHAKTNAEAEAEARAKGKLCLPVRVTTEDGSFLHAPSECRR